VGRAPAQAQGQRQRQQLDVIAERLLQVLWRRDRPGAAEQDQAQQGQRQQCRRRTQRTGERGRSRQRQDESDQGEPDEQVRQRGRERYREHREQQQLARQALEPSGGRLVDDRGSAEGVKPGLHFFLVKTASAGRYGTPAYGSIVP
jgi:hypothetical protein